MVDTVLYFEGNFTKDYRILKSFKNRFGGIFEIGLFRMTEKGLGEVADKNSVFMDSFAYSSPGSAISSAIEGTRSILFEVQSLVSFSSFPNPRRMADGFDLNRLILIIAVLEKHARLKLGTFDVFLNVACGFNVSETSADLAVAMAITSSLKEEPVQAGTGIIGEISLSGEVRPATQIARRIQELKKSGFNRIIVSKSDHEEAKRSFDGEVVGVESVGEAVKKLFG